MKRLWTTLTVLALATAIAIPAGAITKGGVPDTNNDYPAVVLIVMDVGGAPAYTCSGTLIEPTYVLTAGHCTNGFPDVVFSDIRIFTEQDVENGSSNFPFDGPLSVGATRWAAHPAYETAPFFFNDVGMIELEAAVNLPASEYGDLPELDEIDDLRTGHATKFTAVGYGMQVSTGTYNSAIGWTPSPFQGDYIRMVARPWLIQSNVPGFTGDFSLLLSNNASTGGTCFGDSGGPNFLGDSMVIGGVTSFGLNGSCGGTGGVFRLDRENVHDFINGFMNP